MIEETLDYLYGLKREGIKLDLEATREFANHLGNPEKNFKNIHVAGTNGKGSISSYPIWPIMLTSGLNILVESSLPPNPTSMTP